MKKKTKKKEKMERKPVYCAKFCTVAEFLEFILITNSTIFIFKKSPKLPKDSKTSNLFCQISSMHG
jgi:hypothetical protein